MSVKRRVVIPEEPEIAAEPKTCFLHGSYQGSCPICAANRKVAESSGILRNFPCPRCGKFAPARLFLRAWHAQCSSCNFTFSPKE